MAANLVSGALLWWKKYPINPVTRFFPLECDSASYDSILKLLAILGFGFGMGPKLK